jgi:apolipoprotein N-acyltransferase
MNGIDLMVSTGAGAMVVVSGGLYALLLALGRLRESKRLEVLSGFAYFVLAVFVFVLAQSLEIGGAWYAVIAVMLIGYLVAPRVIWRLTAATHTDASGKSR